MLFPVWVVCLAVMNLNLSVSWIHMLSLPCILSSETCFLRVLDRYWIIDIIYSWLLHTGLDTYTQGMIVIMLLHLLVTLPCEFLWRSIRYQICVYWDNMNSKLRCFILFCIYVTVHYTVSLNAIVTSRYTETRRHLCNMIKWYPDMACFTRIVISNRTVL